MADPVHIDGNLWRAAGGRLWLHLEAVPNRAYVDESSVITTLARLGASFDRSGFVCEPLQEDWFLPFGLNGERLSLDRDHWTGLSILSHSPKADDVVHRIRAAVAESPPSAREPGDERTVASRAFIAWLQQAPGGADLSSWR